MATPRCVTNNPMLLNRGFSALEYYDIDVLSLFRILKKEIGDGYRILSHPLTGSIRPDITPYKSVLLSAERGTMDMESIRLINQAIRYAEDLYELREKPLYQLWDEAARQDFQLVDLSIIEQALEVEQIKR